VITKEASFVQNKLDSLLKETENWSTEGAFLGYIIDDTTGKELKEKIDVSIHIGCDDNNETAAAAHRADFQQHRKKNTAKRIYLEPKYNSNTSKGRQSVISFISNIFDSCSSGITSSGTTADNPNAIVFRCFCYKICKPKGAGNTQGVQSRETMMVCPQSSEDCCKWMFTVFFNPNQSWYYFFEHGVRNHFHNGHVPKKQHEVMKRNAQLDVDELEITDDGIDVNLSSQSMSMLFFNQTGLVVDPRKIQRNYVTKTQSSKTSSNKAGASQVIAMTPAKQIISDLTSDKMISLVYLVANVRVGKDCASTYTSLPKKNSMGKKELDITFESNTNRNGEVA
jgi:hypothetical protein